MLRLLTLLWATCTLLASPARAADWVYFDLGEVLITGTPATGYTFVPGVLDHLEKLHAAGYQLGIISNTPEAWGSSCRAKFATFQNFIAPRLREAKPFPWTLFTNVVQPPFDRYRKPQPFMFLHGLAQACPGRVLYVSETQGELDEAKKLGFATFLKEKQNDWPEVAEIGHLLDQQFHFAYPGNCDLRPSIATILLEQDRSGGINGCVSIP